MPSIVLQKDDFTELTPPQMARHFDAFNHNGKDMIIPGIKRYGPMAIKGIRDVRLHEQLLKAFANCEAKSFEIDFGEDKFQFKAFVDCVVRHSAVDAVDSSDVSLRITGPVNIVSRKKEQSMSPKKIQNRFYVSHNKVHSLAEQNQKNEATVIAQPPRWTRNTLKDAIKHAEAILEANPQQEEACVVQIVRRVRRRKLPMIVESVR